MTIDHFSIGARSIKDQQALQLYYASRLIVNNKSPFLLSSFAHYLLNGK
jgi:uncharacterized membrane protein YebE (DUF533 family)